MDELFEGWQFMHVQLQQYRPVRGQYIGSTFRGGGNAVNPVGITKEEAGRREQLPRNPSTNEGPKCPVGGRGIQNGYAGFR